MMKGLAIVMLLLVFCLSVYPAVFTFSQPEYDDWLRMDKVTHFWGYGLIAALSYQMDRMMWPEDDNLNPFLCAAVNSIASGFSYEVVNGFYPIHGDGFSYRDFIADVGGAFLGSELSYLIHKEGSTWLYKRSLDWRQNGWMRFTAFAIVGGANYAWERTAHTPEAISDDDLFWKTPINILVPEISINVSQFLFYPENKRENVYWENLLWDAGGLIVGTLIAKQFTHYNPNFKMAKFFQMKF